MPDFVWWPDEASVFLINSGIARLLSHLSLNLILYECLSNRVWKIKPRCRFGALNTSTDNMVTNRICSYSNKYVGNLSNSYKTGNVGVDEESSKVGLYLLIGCTVNEWNRS